MNIIHYSIQSFFTNEYYSIIRSASKRLFVATLTLSNPVFKIDISLDFLFIQLQLYILKL